MMLGYVHETTKVWRVYDFETKKAVETSDVTFREGENAIEAISDGNDVILEDDYSFPADSAGEQQLLPLDTDAVPAPVYPSPIGAPGKPFLQGTMTIPLPVIPSCYN